MLVVFVIIPAIIGLVFAIIGIVKHRYRKFIKKYSISVKRLNDLNSHFKFEKVDTLELGHDYDSEVNYNNVSCDDYLIGYMSEKMNYFAKQLQSSEINRVEYKRYTKALENFEIHQGFDGDIRHFNEKKLLKFEEKIFNEVMFHPTLEFVVSIFIRYVDMGKNVRSRKRLTINENEVKEYFRRLKNKTGHFYNDEMIWNSLVNYERGKISLHLRFYIYERDHYTCKKCGRRGKRANLEVDHIVPISKGGKSTVDNLQTLCHRCNQQKGTNINRY